MEEDFMLVTNPENFALESNGEGPTVRRRLSSAFTQVGYIFDDYAAILRGDPALAGKNLGFLEALFYPGLWASFGHRLAYLLHRLRIPVIPGAIAAVFRFLTGVEIHPGAFIDRGLFIDHGMGTVIGETAEIGKDATIFHQATLGGRGGGTGKRHPTVGDRVVIGAGAMILGPVRIGNDAKIGAGAVVLESVPPRATAVGVPARIIPR
jgi:serine O-acetyltransferase